MPVKAYAKKVDEDEKMVYYSFGVKRDELIGLAKIEKSTLKLFIEDEKSEKIGRTIMISLLEKIVKGYDVSTGFPEEVSGN